MAKIKPESTPTDGESAGGAADDGSPELTKAQAREIADAARISDEDIDAAGELWKRHAPDELSGLWDAEIA